MRSGFTLPVWIIVGSLLLACIPQPMPSSSTRGPQPAGGTGGSASGGTAGQRSMPDAAAMPAPDTGSMGTGATMPDAAPAMPDAAAPADVAMAVDASRPDLRPAEPDLAPARSEPDAAPAQPAGKVPPLGTTPMPVAGQIPIAFLGLPASNWKITKPDATEVTNLSSYSSVPHFYVDARGYVNFRAEAGGTGTKNSRYPRSELRELPGNWSTSSGTHTMILTQAITYTLVEKQHVVAGQIHDASDDVIMIRLEGRHLFVEAGGTELTPSLDTNYQLGTKFTVKIEAAGGQIRVYYNDMTTPKVTYKKSVSGCYFKAGVYTQSTSDASQASDTRKPEDPSAYGEVHLYEMKVTHTN